MSDIAKRIRRVKWVKLEDAEGSANSVGDLLLDQLDDDPHVREDNLEQLEDVLVADQMFFSASRKALPFILELAFGPAPDPPELLRLATEIVACGATTRPSGLDFSDTAIKHAYSKGDGKKLLAALTERVDEIAAAASSDEPRMRASAAFALAHIPTASDGAVASLARGFEEEPNEVVMLTQGVALGHHAGYGSERAQRVLLTTLRAEARSPMQRAGALLGLAACTPDLEPPTSAFEVLLGVEPASRQLFPWNDGYIADFAALRLWNLGPDVHRQLVATVLSAIETRKADHRQLHLRVLEASGLARVDRPIDAATLRPWQRDIVQRLSTPDVDYSPKAFRAVGIPNDLPTRRRFIGLDPSGVLERPITLDLPYGDAPPDAPLYMSFAAFDVDGPRSTIKAMFDALDALHESLLGELSLAETVEAYLDWSGYRFTYGPLDVRARDGRLARQFLEAGESALSLAERHVDKCGPSEHATVALTLMARAHGAFEARFDDLIVLNHGVPDGVARELLAPLPSHRREPVIARALAEVVRTIKFGGVHDLPCAIGVLDLAPSPANLKTAVTAARRGPKNYDGQPRERSIAMLFELAAQYPRLAQELAKQKLSAPA